MHSPLKRCGKCRLLEVIEALVHQPLYRTIEAAGKRPPTLLFDEVDRLFGSAKKDEDNRELIALLNNGFRPGRPTIRCVGPNQTPTPFSNFAMAAVAGIGRKPDTIEDRAINITMRRRLPGEKVAKLRLRTALPPLHELRDRLAGWTGENLDLLGKPVDDIPDELEDRAQDCWEPLLAVADLAGGRWPQAARQAAKALVVAEESVDVDASLGQRLLADLRDVFGDADRLSTETILERLKFVDEAPWDDLFGRPIDARGLARRLAPYEVKPRQVRIGDKTVKGYPRTAFHDAWARYLPSVGNIRNEGNTAGQSVSDNSMFRMEGKHDSEGNALTSSVAHVSDVSVPRKTTATIGSWTTRWPRSKAPSGRWRSPAWSPTATRPSSPRPTAARAPGGHAATRPASTAPTPTRCAPPAAPRPITREDNPMTDQTQQPDPALVDDIAAAVAERLAVQPEPDPDDVLRAAGSRSAVQRGQAMLSRLMNGPPRRQPPTNANGQPAPDARQGVRGPIRSDPSFAAVADTFMRGNRRNSEGMSWSDAVDAARTGTSSTN